MLNTGLDQGALALLEQGYRNNWQQYVASLNGARPRILPWDICVLTASNERQAEAYQAQLEARRESGLLPTDTQFEVIPDPDGLRIGSGGATLRVLSVLAQELCAHHPDFENPFAGRRILMIHSGGDSKRLPHCSAIGKLFARVPHQLPDGRPSSLFDELLVSFSGLPGQVPPGILVASGDTLVLFDHLQLTLASSGVVGVAAAAPADVGTHHGVYVTQGSSRRVHGFLHKPSMERMRADGALQPDGRVQIDTGLVWFDPHPANRALSLAEGLAELISQGVTINLYGDILAPLAQTADYATYLADTSDGPATLALQQVRRMVWETMRRTPFTVEVLHPAVFVHFGTTREYLDVLREGVRLFGSCGWRGQTTSWVPPAALVKAGERLLTVNSYVRGGTLSDGCLLDSRLETRLELEGEALLAHVTTEREALTLRSGVALDQIPLHQPPGWVTRFFGLGDDPKRSLDDGGTFLNLPWQEWLGAANVSANDVWPGAEHSSQCTLWEAKLYPLCGTREESLDLVVWMQAPETAPSELVARWRDARRLSLGESYVQADVRRLVREEAEIEDRVRARHFCAGVEREQPASDLAQLLGAPRDRARRARLVGDWLEASLDPWLPMRGYKALEVATHERRWEDRAFSSLARLVRAHTRPPPPARLADGLAQRRVRVRAAARIDFSAGWNDTPPHSLERGGTVLNAAVRLNGELPIVVEAELLDEPVLVLESPDMNATFRPRHAGDVLNYANPADPFALHKASLVFRGIVPSDTPLDARLADTLRPGGYGLRLMTATSIPRGSGLGTSSILAGAILHCLARLLGQEIEQAQLFDEVLCLEQMITTGGGWQDQIGGLVGGIKLITTEPGLPQVAHLEPVPLTPTLKRALDERLVLVYTGQRRLAKNLLRAVMGRWMARDPQMVEVLHGMGRLALRIRDALVAEDLDTFGELVAQHWEMYKLTDPGCTNPFIDSLLALCQPYMMGAKLAGAGGGGFAMVIARDARAALGLRDAVKRRFPQGNVAVWDCEVAEEALVYAT